MKNKHLYYIFILFTISCTNDNQSFDSMFKHRKKVILENVSFINKDDLLSPENIAVKDSLCVIYEPQGEKLLTVFDLKNKTKKKELLAKGNGPGEAICLQTILFDGQQDIFYCNDVAQNKLNIFSTQNFNLLEQKKINFSFATFTRDMNNWIFSIVGQSKPFVFLKNNEEEKRFGSPVKISHVEPNIITQVLQGPIAVTNTPIKKLAWFSVYGEVFQIYNYDNSNDIKLVKEIVINLPIFDESGAMDMDTKLGINSLSSSENYIFALYSNNFLRDALTLRKDIFNSKNILVYDWNGLPIVLLELDKEVLAIAYNKSDDTLYCLGLDDDKDYQIFTIKEIEKKLTS